MVDNESLPEQPPRKCSSLALNGLFVLAVFYTFYFARMFFLPLFLALFLNLLLSPLVAGLKKIKIPNGLGAGIVVLALVGMTISLSSLLAQPASEWISRAPKSLKQIEVKLRYLKEPVEKISRAAEGVEKLTQIGKNKGVALEQISFFHSLSGGVKTFSVTMVLLVFLLYFLLASGDLFLRKLIEALRTLADKKRAIEIVRHLEKDISYYLLTITLINGGLGCAVGIAMYFSGMPNPVLWGAMAATLNFIPYVGAMAGVVIMAVASALTFELPKDILLPPLAYIILTSSEGYFITPLIIGRRLTLNPFVVLLGLFFWGWMWGIVGAILAVPLLVCFKIICEHVPSWSPLSEFLGSE